MLTSDLNLSKNCKRIEILKCVLKNVHYYYYYMEVFKAARNKLFATNEKQINNYTLTLDTLHSCRSVVYTYQ